MDGNDGTFEQSPVIFLKIMRKKYIYLCAVAVVITTALAIWMLCSGEKEKYEGLPVQETALREFVDLSEDSTYLVFVFIPSCKYCQNSVANLNEYETKGVVDRVIGLTVRDSIAETYFAETYKPCFQIISCDIFKLLEFNNRFPTSYYIENNVILKVFRGELPDGKKFFKKAKSKTNQC
jgi:hypothetical protein